MSYINPENALKHA